MVHAEYAEIPAVLAELNETRVDGILLDLGVSSPQLDHADRGFSFMKTGPLDMRMDPTRGKTALDLIRELDPDDLADVIFELGEERYSKKIARLIKEEMGAGKTISLAGRNDAFGTGLLPILKSALEKIGMKTQGPLLYDPTAASYNS